MQHWNITSNMTACAEIRNKIFEIPNKKRNGNTRKRNADKLR